MQALSRNEVRSCCCRQRGGRAKERARLVANAVHGKEGRGEGWEREANGEREGKVKEEVVYVRIPSAFGLPCDP